MENSFQTSFIPKKPIISTPNNTRPRVPTSIFSVISFFILILVSAAAGGLFLYKNYLIKQEEVLSSSLEKVRVTFEKNTLDELELYDKRVGAADKILSKHIVFSPLFELLGQLTIPSIQYTNFTQQTNADGFSVKLSGVATDYKSIALQADAFNSAKGRSLKNIVFSNISKDKTNKVAFNIEFIVDPSLLNYEKNMILNQIVNKNNKPSETPVNNLTNQENTTLPSDQSQDVTIPEEVGPPNLPVNNNPQ